MHSAEVHMEQTVASKDSSEILKMCGMWPVWFLHGNFNKHFWLGSIASFLAKNLDVFDGPVSGKTYSYHWGWGLFIRRSVVSKIWEKRCNIIRGTYLFLCLCAWVGHAMITVKPLIQTHEWTERSFCIGEVTIINNDITFKSPLTVYKCRVFSKFWKLTFWHVLVLIGITESVMCNCWQEMEDTANY